MVAFIDQHRAEHGVEPICAQLPIAPSTQCEFKARQVEPSRLPARTKRDAELCGETWSGFVYVAFVIDVFARRIIGWRVATSMRTDLVLDALEQTPWSRVDARGVVHHSDRGSRYLSIRSGVGVPCSPEAAGPARPDTDLRFSPAQLAALVEDMTEALRVLGVGTVEAGEVVSRLYAAREAAPPG